MKFLKQKKTGRVYVWTEIFANRKDMVPYVPELKPETALDTEDLDGNTDKPLAELLEGMTKAQIEVIAYEHFGVDLDRRKSKADLIEQTLKLHRDNPPQEDF